MTSLSALADCIRSGQVDDAEAVRLCHDYPGLVALLERRSCAVPACAGRTGQGGASAPPPSSPSCSVHPFDLNGQAALSRGAGHEECRGPLKTGGFLSQFFRSCHLTSVLPRNLWRQ